MRRKLPYEQFNFSELVGMLKRKFTKGQDFTDYCSEPECYEVVGKYGMLCFKHRKGD